MAAVPVIFGSPCKTSCLLAGECLGVELTDIHDWCREACCELAITEGGHAGLAG